VPLWRPTVIKAAAPAAPALLGTPPASCDELDAELAMMYHRGVRFRHTAHPEVADPVAVALMAVQEEEPNMSSHQRQREEEEGLEAEVCASGTPTLALAPLPFPPSAPLPYSSFPITGDGTNVVSKGLLLTCCPTHPPCACTLTPSAVRCRHQRQAPASLLAQFGGILPATLFCPVRP